MALGGTTIQKDHRSEIVMGFNRCIERDYRQIHPSLLYAQAGKRLEGDAYDIGSWERKLVKRATNTLINAETELAALKSIALMMGGPGAYDRARQLIGRIKAKHADIAEWFGSGAGLRLMRIDSDMAEMVMLELIDRGLCALPIHDSFLIEHQHVGILDEIMEQVLDLTLRRISGSAPTIIGISENVPQYGDTVSLSERPP